MSPLCARFEQLAGVTGIEIGRRFLLPLRHHLGRIRRAWHAARAEPLALLIVLGLPGAAVIDLRAPSAPVLVMDLLAALEVLASGRIAFAGHRDVLHC